MSREESRLKRVPSSSVPRIKVLLKLEPETFEGLVLEFGLVAKVGREPPGKAGREPRLLPRSLRKQTPSM
eukprot:2133669-Pleurochrysis_carterae.AAC.1